MLDLLSPELVELVLSHLDRPTLKSCLEVSKIFRDVIIHSPKMMKKLVLRLDDKNWMSKIPFIKSYGMYIRTVEIHCNSKTCTYFQLLYFMPNITKLKVVCSGYKECSPQNLSDQVDAELNLGQLEEFFGLFFNFDPESILKGLQQTKSIKKLFYRCQGNVKFEQKAFVNILCQQLDLTDLELDGVIFSEEIVDRMQFKLKCLTLVSSYSYDSNLTPTLCWNINRFLLKQTDSLEELRVFFSSQFQDDVYEGILKLQKLKRLTTRGLLPCMKINLEKPEVDRPILPSLTHFRFYQGNGNEVFDKVDITSVPNLQSLNVHFGFDHRHCGCYPEVKVNNNLLRKLKNLKEFHIESYDQDLLRYLASSSLQTLVIKADDILDVESWSLLSNNLPELKSLTVSSYMDEGFLNFIIENYKICMQKIPKLEVLQLLWASEDIKLYTANGIVTKVFGTCCSTNSILLKKIDVLKETFENFDYRIIDLDDFEGKYEYMQFYFHACGP